jgi:nucleosome binding factor SPN SPT16 subunit
MVSIGNKEAEVLTKMGKAITDVAYNINDEGSDENASEEDDDDDEDGAKGDKKKHKGDAALARRLAREQLNEPASNGLRKSGRLARDSTQQDVAEGHADRERRQIALMQRRNEERIREIARENMKNKGKGQSDDQPDELQSYRGTNTYPAKVQPNQVMVDMVSQCVLLPVCGNPVPFHISTIKNVVLPDPDNNATLLRINFYSAGMAVGKDAPVNMAKLVQKYAPYASFIREMTFRSLDGRNLEKVSYLHPHWNVDSLHCFLNGFARFLFEGLPSNLRTAKTSSHLRAPRV